MAKEKNICYCEQTLPGAELAIKRIVDEIGKKGIKKQKVADEIGITPQHLSGVLNKRHPLTADIKTGCYRFLGLK